LVFLFFNCSERASETNNAGQKLRDGANINKSLLALANCINALGKQQKKGLAYVPYRNRFVTEKVYLNVKLQWFLGHSACSSRLMQWLF
jgi:hypothetical protein